MSWRNLLVVAICPISLPAQTPPAAPSSVSTIAPAEIASDLAALAVDSLRDRDTPSPGLEATARYVAAAFGRLGLLPGVQNDQKPAWTQRYPIPGQQRVSASSMLHLIANLRRHGKAVVDDAGESRTRLASIKFATAAYLAPEVGRQALARKSFNLFVYDVSSLGNPLVMVTGRHTVASVRQDSAAFRDRAVLYVPVVGVDTVLRREIIAELYAASQGVIIASDDDTVGFAAILAAGHPPAVFVDDYMQAATGPRRWPWAVWLWAGRLREVLEMAGEDLTRLRADAAPVVQVLPFTRVFVAPEAEAVSADLITAPNVVGVIEGSDPALRNQYIVVTTHMDGHGASSDQAGDGTAADAIDNSAGVAALLAVAKAFGQSNVRPRRSVVLIAVSGGTQESWGANYFADHRTMRWTARRGAVDVAVSLTLDLRGGVGHDSLVVGGLRDVEFPVSPAWIAATYPELGLAVVDGGTVTQPNGGHFAFVQRWVPSLYVHIGETNTRPKVRTGSVRSTTADAERVARIAQFLFYMAQAAANADRAPRWSTEGRRQLGTSLVP